MTVPQSAHPIPADAVVNMSRGGVVTIYESTSHFRYDSSAPSTWHGQACGSAASRRWASPRAASLATCAARGVAAHSRSRALPPPPPPRAIDCAAAMPPLPASPHGAAMDVRLSHVTLLAHSTVHPPRDDQATPHLPSIGRELRGLVSLFLRRAKPRVVDRAILRDVSGVFATGTMTLVLGQPGSGKSSLLKLLSGRLRLGKKALRCAGGVAYNGVPQSELLPTLPQLVSYVPQRDRHFATLSVRETIEFAHACGAQTTASDELQAHGEDALPHPTPDVILRQLGIDHCQDTVVGDAMLRGVSGGERKRVTLGEMDVGGRLMACLDEISTGLDSAATLDIVAQQRALATSQRKTVVMALLQPAPEVVELFDTVVLLNDGFVLYHGPRTRIAEHFESLGLRRPPHRDLADFLMDIGTSQQEQYAQAESTPRTPRQFAARFQQSDIHQANVRAVEAPMDAALTRTASQLHAVPQFYQSFCHNVSLLVKRDLVVMLRNRAALQARLATLVVASLIHATLFYQLDPANAQLTMGILFASVLFLALENASQIPAFQAAREMFYKQRAANLFRTSAYVVATSVAQMPMAIVQTLVFGSIVYWLCGFVASAAPFVTFELLMLLTNLAFNAWFFFLAVTMPNLHVAEPFNLLSLLIFILFAGFMITRDLIPDYFIWAYWASPISWGLRSIVINQYRADEFSECVYKGVDYCAKYGASSMGEYALSTYQVQTERFWLWLGLGFMVMSYVLFLWLSTLVLEHVRYEDDNHDHATTTTDSETAVAVVHGDATSSSGADDDTSGSYQLAKSPRDSAVSAKVAYERHFVPVTLAFQDLWYSVPNPKNPKESLTLLKGISGYARPGTMTALMGSSGAGKTTLMDVIAGRKTGGEVKGEIFLNGYSATDMVIRRSTAYCEQMDVHADASTIREALTFSAFMRQSSSVPASHKHESVEECLDLLDLRPVANRIIRGGSVELMKRLTIGVELAAQPSVLFLDEPTSGLDARAAKMIMDGVRNVANSGRTVVCTIHQPSFEVFQVFDNLLLLKRGGETVYFGELGSRGQAIVAYFRSVVGVTAIPSAEYNPATWMLEVIGAGVGDKSDASVVTVEKDFVGLFNASDKKRRLDEALAQDGMLRPAHGVAALSFDNKRAASEAEQARALLVRFFRTYWRTPDYMLTRFTVYVVLALVFGLAFLNRDFDTYQGINAGVGMVYSTTAFIGVIAFDSAMPLAAEMRAPFYRERASQTYNALWYFVGSSIVEIPYVFITTMAFCGEFYVLAGFRGVGTFVLYWVHSSLHVLLHTYLGEFLAIALPDLGAAMTAGVVITTICFNTMGFNPPASALPPGYKWLYEIVPTQFPFSIVGAVLFGRCDHPDDGHVGCTVLKGELPLGLPRGTTVKEYVDKIFLISRDDIYVKFGIVVGYIALLRVLTLLALRFVNHQRR